MSTKIINTNDENPLISQYMIPGFKNKSEETAKQAAEAEVEYWVALLSYLPVAKLILDNIDYSILLVEEEDRPEASQREELRSLIIKFEKKSLLSKKNMKRWTELCYSLANEIRVVDGDRIWMKEADNIAHNYETSSLRYKNYIETVDEAYKKQKSLKEIFIRSNVGLVLKIAGKYRRSNLSYVDLIQEGIIGLMKAMERYDYARGYKFSTYGSWWIKHSVMRSIANKHRTVRFPVHVLAKHRQILRASNKLKTKTGEQPTVEEISKETGFSKSIVEDISSFHTGDSFSLNDTVTNDAETTFLDMVEDDNAYSIPDIVDMNKFMENVRPLIDKLKPIEKNIINWRFGLNGSREMTLLDIGKKYGLCRERIRQLEDSALKKLKKQLDQKEMS